ncbi:aspartate dehydrogenase [Allopusillimonas ginsengisoli]|uniref:aspartate dehydrogenase n=1 Tax=Allopusillimonas ginsengisoli TaxID=453575 RepID=UPI0039C33674
MKTAHSSTPRKIALIGFGSIAQDVLTGLKQVDPFPTDCAVVLRPDSGSRRNVPKGVAMLSTLDELLTWGPSLVIEAAGQDAARENIPALLEHGIDVLITSVGALADNTTYAAMVNAARKGQCRLIIPAGAVASLDYLGALGNITPVSVVYESRKPVAAWREELRALGIDPDTLDEEVELFAGSANEAALRYPKNLNVAATLALAGVGMAQTRVRVVVDPRAAGNQHRVTVQSALGTLETTLVNNPSPGNPKTSWIVSQSVIHAVRRQFATVLIGG